MSVCLIYFEKKQYPEDGDFTSFREVNNYITPKFWKTEKVVVIDKGREFDASIFFDGVSSNFFSFFDNSSYGRESKDCRQKLYDFISKRLTFGCIQSYLFFFILDGNFNGRIILPNNEAETIHLDELELVFLRRYWGFYRILK